MEMHETILKILDRELHLEGQAMTFSRKTKLWGSLPQLDSIAVVSVIAALEEELGIEIPTEQLEGAMFESVGTLDDAVKRLNHSR